METQKMKIAILILNWNGVNWLKKFLSNIHENRGQSKIFIIDNNSSDNSIEFIKNSFSDIQVIQHKKNLGYAKGYNEAIKKIDAKYFVLLNSDIETSNQWITPIISLLDNNPDIAACQPKILDYNIREKFEYAGAAGGFIDFLGYPFCRGRIIDEIEKDSGQYNDAKEIFWATGACLFIRSSAFKEVEGFDNMFFAHQEEIDLCWRLKNKGYKIMVEPKSIVYHVGGGTLDNNSPFKTYLNFRNNLSMIFKNLPLPYLIFVIPIRLLLDGIAALSLLRKKGIRHFISIFKAHISFYYRIPLLFIKRKEINQKYQLDGKYNWTILIKYFIRKKRKFSDL